MEEELLRNLDMDLFEQINVPHELDAWGRRVYNDCGHRILYFQDEDGNTVLGYEAWYPCSVVGDVEEPDEWRVGRQNYERDVDGETEYQGEGNTVISGSESWYSTCSTLFDFDQHIYMHTTVKSDTSALEIEQRRFAEFLAAQDHELPQFASDRERVAAWIGSSFPTADREEIVSVWGDGTGSVASQWSEIR